MSPVEYAGGKRPLRAYIAACLQIHCNLSRLILRLRYTASMSLVLPGSDHVVGRQEMRHGDYDIETLTVHIYTRAVCAVITRATSYALLLLRRREMRTNSNITLQQSAYYYAYLLTQCRAAPAQVT